VALAAREVSRAAGAGPRGRGGAAAHAAAVRHLTAFEAAHGLQAGGARESAQAPDEIPRLVHQQYSSADVPQRWALAHKSWAGRNPGYKCVLWTDDDLNALGTPALPCVPARGE
jgi:hypothetical protein